MRKIVIIPAAGSGTRCNSDIPKQFIKINDREILSYTLEAFDKHDGIDNIIVVTSKEYFELIQNIAKNNKISKLIEVVEGGKERQDSVYNALEYVLNNLEPNSDDIILVHDAARPLISSKIISNIIENVLKFDASVTAIKAKDTILEVLNNNVAGFVNREKIYYAQTPQAFKFNVLYQCFKKSYEQNLYFTDESTMLKYFGYKVFITNGDISNFKVTTPDDLELLKKILGKNGN
ncbi:MAG TPA: 2-C-methyl-D-erythritol 4-phosphate cytidylyltransferase [Ignavibacteriales bacterium]|nr:2-C-methyl-D-erythritol 4-phosphate cytidylyltransferase [Ignavibacteriales bacterium]